MTWNPLKWLRKSSDDTSDNHPLLVMELAPSPNPNSMVSAKFHFVLPPGSPQTDYFPLAMGLLATGQFEPAIQQGLGRYIGEGGNPELAKQIVKTMKDMAGEKDNSKLVVPPLRATRHNLRNR